MGYQFPFNATVENLTKLLCSTSEKIFVAVSDGRFAGYVHANDYDLIYAPHMKNIMGITVSGEYTQQGIGRALLQQVEQWALETGASGIRLVSGATGTDAQRHFYRCKPSRSAQRESPEIQSSPLLIFQQNYSKSNTSAKRSLKISKSFMSSASSSTDR